MVEIISKFLDSLYETSKSCNESDVYEFQKEWYENNGYKVIFENGHHKVYHKENNQFDIEQEGGYMKRIKYYKELSNIIDGYIILIRDFKLSKNPQGAKCRYQEGA